MANRFDHLVDSVDDMRLELVRQTLIVNSGWLQALKEYETTLKRIIKDLEA